MPSSAGRKGADAALRDHLQKFLASPDAHPDFTKALADVPSGERGVVPEGLPYSLWQLAEHTRLAQADILEFCRSSSYREKKFPEDYWPKAAAPTDAEWKECLAGFKADLAALRQMAADDSVDLSAKIPHGDGQTYLREILLVIDHNSYHIGQMVLVRRLLGIWE